MMHDRTLRLPCSTVATDERRLQRLISQGVLASATDAAIGQAIGFGHQTLLDALAVRAALAAGQTLAAFILAHPPFPFLRPAVRGFAMHLRATDPVAFRRQLRAAVGEPGIAYHLKRVLIESLADLIPTDEDWPLIRHLWQTHQDLFRRLLWQVRHDEWFRLLHEHWWPMLGDDSADDAARGHFFMRLDQWMNRSPAEVVALWRQAIDSQWGVRQNLAWNIEIQLRDFLYWDKTFSSVGFRNRPDSWNLQLRPSTHGANGILRNTAAAASILDYLTTRNGSSSTPNTAYARRTGSIIL